MFRIGEFSRIAQVSGRLLRYYDQIGLLIPDHIDAQTGYRYYSATQLPRLNRILALKELGFSLEQVGQMVAEEISQEELHGMLKMKKAQIAQTIQEEIERLRHIESRIEHLDEEKPVDVVVKSLPALNVLALRRTFPSLDEARALLGQMRHTLPSKVPPAALGSFVVELHGDAFELEAMDMRMGFVVEGRVPEALTLGDDLALTRQTLPALPTAATAVRVGGIERGHLSYGAIGAWVEANGYRFAGPVREYFIQLPGPNQDAVTEIQYPVEKVQPSLPA